MYFPLHVHTCKGSIGDSILKIKDYVKKAKTLGLDRLVITNHGSMADMYEFYYECKKNDIIPIIGCEVYITKEQEQKAKKDYSHLVLIAKNDIGLKNLLYIVSDANLNGMYYKPRTDLKILKEHSEGIIALSACVAGEIPKAILKLQASEEDNQEECYLELNQLINSYKDTFEELYLEIQPGKFTEQIEVNKAITYLAQEYNLPVVVTNDVHYLDKEDAFIHNAHICIERKMDFQEELLYRDDCYYFMSESEVRNELTYIDNDLLNQAIKNTELIAKKCEINLEIDKLDMPSVDIPNNYTEDQYLTVLAIKALNKKMSEIGNPISYMDRTFYELDVLSALGFSGYFLTLKDKVDYAKENNIPIGPGRGSVCGSLVAYLIGITAVDPIKYNLMFERFLSIYRVGTVPDIDFDVSSSKREEIFKYTINKHGADKCALVSTFGIRKAKSSIKDVARILGIDLELSETVAKLIPTVFYDEEGEKTTDLSIEDSLKISKELREYQETYPKWFELAIKLEGLPRNSSIHAAGTLIATKPLIETLPLRKPSEDSFMNATALNLHDAETAGKIKFDYLGLSTLDIIGISEEETQFKFNYDDESLLHDDKVWDLIGSKNTTTLFQIGSKTYKDRMNRLAPKTIEQLAACLALVRGPCIADKLDEVYMQIIEGKQKIKLLHPIYDNVTKDTNGIIIYQEQIIQLLTDIGFEPEKSFKIMKYLAKKKVEEIASSKAEYDELTSKIGMTKDISDHIWALLEKQGLYCFNKSHAIAYALVCYATAYYKIYYPLQWMAAALTNAYERKEEVEETVFECRRLGIKFTALDYNTSVWRFTVDTENSLNIGICAIKGFGIKGYEAIVNNRPYTSLEDMLNRVPKRELSKTRMLPAIFAGMFHTIDNNFNTIYQTYCDYRGEEKSTTLKIARESIDLDECEMNIEAFVLGCPLMTSPVNDFEPINFNALPKNKIFTIRAVVSRVKKLKDCNQNNMAFLTLETGDGVIDGIVFANQYKECRKYMKKGLLIDVKAKKDKDDSCIITEIS